MPVQTKTRIIRTLIWNERTYKSGAFRAILVFKKLMFIIVRIDIYRIVRYVHVARHARARARPRARSNTMHPLRARSIHAGQTDNEGAVIYLEDSCDKCIGLVKVKTNHYVIARRTRQTFWGALIDPLLAGKLSDGPVPPNAKPATASIHTTIKCCEA